MTGASRPRSSTVWPRASRAASDCETVDLQQFGERALDGAKHGLDLDAAVFEAGGVLEFAQR